MTSKWGPLSGIVFLALLIGGGLYGGKPPGENEKLTTPQALSDAYAAQADRLGVAVFVMALAVVFFIYFASTLKSALDDGSAEASSLSRVAFTGAIIFAVGAAIDLTLMLAMISAAKDEVDPVAIQALSSFWSDDFIPFAIGIVLLTSASALSILRHGGLPKWLGWLAALIAVMAVIPTIGSVSIAPASFPAAGVWVLLASIVLLLRPAAEAEPRG